MAYNILLTSLYDAGQDTTVRYFYSRDGYRNYYCDAVMTVEASAKHVLAMYPVDEIITLGRKLTFDEGDDDRLIELAEGKTFYTASIGDLSTYSLFRYRIAQYIDELKIEQREIVETLSEEEQKQVINFIQDYYRQSETEDKHRKFNRLFDELAQTPGAYARLKQALLDTMPEAAAEPKRYLDWVKCYLYRELKETNKLEMLKENEDVKVRFVPTTLTDDGEMPIDNMRQLVHMIVNDHADEDKVNLYVALNNDDLTDNFVLMNVLDMIRVMPKTNVRINDIMTTSDVRSHLAGEIRNDTDVYGITELVAATRTFLQYGKVDMIVDFWEKSGAHNERIENMIYAMRRIDLGLSLCNIREMENGIEELRDLFSHSSDMGGDDNYSKLYTVIAEAIQRDYGPLLEGEEIEFIEMVKWGARKRFYQQTLTLIEARAPKAFVENGIFYYCNDEAEKEHVTKLFAEFRNTLKPYELYVMDDIEHYYVKTYGRRVHKKKGKDNQRSYANFRMNELNNTNPAVVTAHTECSDRENLGNLLYAYYHIGDIRNKTNHAEDTPQEDERLIVGQKDIPYRMTQIQESIDYFLIHYDKAMEDLKGKESHLVRISPFDVKAMARRLEDEAHPGDRSGDGGRHGFHRDDRQGFHRDDKQGDQKGDRRDDHHDDQQTDHHKEQEADRQGGGEAAGENSRPGERGNEEKGNEPE